jgi:hypothetical protein
MSGDGGVGRMLGDTLRWAGGLPVDGEAGGIFEDMRTSAGGIVFRITRLGTLFLPMISKIT